MNKLFSYLLLSSLSLPFLFAPVKADDYSLTTDPNSDCTNTDYLKETGQYLGTDRMIPARGENLGECLGSVRSRQGELLEHVNTNASNITTNTSNITTNTSNISTNTSAIQNLQGSSSTSDISANTNNINNLGEGVAGSTALTAALSALPQTSKESKLSCGVGTGAYSSRYAVGFGCASKVNERVDINAGGSYVFGGSKSYGGGTLDSGVVNAGFVFKLG